MLPACTRQTALDAAPAIDVCTLVPPKQVQDLFGGTNQPPDTAPGPTSAGVAGACHWNFVRLGAATPTTVSVTVLTPGAGLGKSGSLDPWSDVNVKEVEATIGPHSELPNLGSRAYLFHSAGSTTSQIWFQYGDSVVILQAYDVSKLDQLAYAVAGDVAAWKPPVAPANGAPTAPAPAVAIVPVSGVDAATRVQQAEAAARQAQSRARDADAIAQQAGQIADDERKRKGKVEMLAMTMGYVDTCIRSDNLLRSVCARLSRVLPEADKPYCQLPPRSFEERTAAAYAAFKQRHAAEIHDNSKEIDSMLELSRSSFEEQFGKMRADSVLMSDLENLSHGMGQGCPAIEAEWLVPRGKDW